jgi:hypothetical protein
VALWLKACVGTLAAGVFEQPYNIRLHVPAAAV